MQTATSTSWKAKNGKKTGIDSMPELVLNVPQLVRQHCSRYSSKFLELPRLAPSTPSPKAGGRPPETASSKQLRYDKDIRQQRAPKRSLYLFFTFHAIHQTFRSAQTSNRIHHSQFICFGCSHVHLFSRPPNPTLST